MNSEEIRVHASRGDILHDPDAGFRIRGVLVTDEADHALCAQVLGRPVPFIAPVITAPVEPVVEPVPEPVPEPEREPMTGVALPEVESVPEAPADAVRDDVAPITPEPEED